MHTCFLFLHLFCICIYSATRNMRYVQRSSDFDHFGRIINWRAPTAAWNSRERDTLRETEQVFRGTGDHNSGAFYMPRTLVFTVSLLRLGSPIRNHSSIYRKTICAPHHAYRETLPVNPVARATWKTGSVAGRGPLRIGFGLIPQHFPSIVAFLAWRDFNLGRHRPAVTAAPMANFPLHHINAFRAVMVCS